MKNAILSLFLFSTSAYALYNGNPSFPMMPEQGVFFTHSWFSLKAGYEFDDLFNRDLKRSKRYASQAQYGVLTMDFADRVELYSALGNMFSKTVQHPAEHTRVHYTTETDFAWSVGGRTILAYWDNLQFGLAASYLQFSPSLKSITVNGSSVPKEDAALHYREWQIGASLAYRIAWLFPYVGLKYSNVRAKFYLLDSLEFLFPQGHFSLENRNAPGLVLGCGFAPERGFNINIEGRFFDETAFTTSADIRF